MCANQSCKHKKAINLKNTWAYAKCFECNGFEHFQCAGTKENQKNKIKENLTKFICSSCLEKNPMLALQSPIVVNSNQESIDLTSNVDEDDTLETLAEIVSEVIEAVTDTEKCDKCDKTFSIWQELFVQATEKIKGREMKKSKE